MIISSSQSPSLRLSKNIILLKYGKFLIFYNLVHFLAEKDLIIKKPDSPVRSGTQLVNDIHLFSDGSEEAFRSQSGILLFNENRSSSYLPNQPPDDFVDGGVCNFFPSDTP